MRIPLWTTQTCFPRIDILHRILQLGDFCFRFFELGYQFVVASDSCNVNKGNIKSCICRDKGQLQGEER